MASGGARNRSGPPPNESSGRSERRGYALSALPAEGFKGRVPAWPLPIRHAYSWEYDDNVRFQVVDATETRRIRARELALWRWAWRTPQACAWSMPSESWRLHTVAMWVRTFVICESDGGSAADKNSLHRFADQIGFTTAGLAEMGWKIKVDELTERAASQPVPTPAAVPQRRRRLRSVGGDAQ